MKTIPFDHLKNEALKDKEVLFYFQEAERDHQLRTMLIKARTKARLSQVELAKKLQVQPSNLCRLEKNPSNSRLETIVKYLNACDATLKLSVHSNSR